MDHLVILLVLLAAFFHASWNFLAKRAGNSPGFIWLCASTASVIYVPVLLIYTLVEKPQLNGLQILFILGTAFLHVAYFFFLQRGYGAGDLSLAYPLARGVGPLLSTLGAVVLLGERPSIIAVIGVILLAGGVLFLVGNPLLLLKKGAQTRVVVGYALLASIFVATYTVWDKYAVSALLVSPLLLDSSPAVVRAAVLTPGVVGGNWEKVKATWRKHHLEAIGVAILSPLAYLLVLFAMKSSPVSYIAPLRESSVLIGTLMGARLLSEKHMWRRLSAASVILVGIILLAIG
jgi:drug/metabolite transporter (DMT)-like permease